MRNKTIKPQPLDIGSKIMVKGKLTNGDLLFGITSNNIELLKQGKPIMINLSEMGMEDRKIYIVFGETETDIVGNLIDADIVTTSTKIKKS